GDGREDQYSKTRSRLKRFNALLAARRVGDRGARVAVNDIGALAEDLLEAVLQESLDTPKLAEDNGLLAAATDRMELIQQPPELRRLLTVLGERLWLEHGETIASRVSTDQPKVLQQTQMVLERRPELHVLPLSEVIDGFGVKRSLSRRHA